MIAIDTKGVPKDNREKYEKIKYNIPIKYYDCEWIISVFETYWNARI